MACDILTFTSAARIKPSPFSRLPLVGCLSTAHFGSCPSIPGMFSALTMAAYNVRRTASANTALVQAEAPLALGGKEPGWFLFRLYRTRSCTADYGPMLMDGAVLSRAALFFNRVCRSTVSSASR